MAIQFSGDTGIPTWLPLTAADAAHRVWARRMLRLSTGIGITADIAFTDIGDVVDIWTNVVIRNELVASEEGEGKYTKNTEKFLAHVGGYLEILGVKLLDLFTRVGMTSHKECSAEILVGCGS